MDLSGGELKKPGSQVELRDVEDDKTERFRWQLSNLRFLSYSQSNPLDSYDENKARYQWRKTKTLATAGPSLHTKEQFKELLNLDRPEVQTDLDGVRLNLSHGTRDFHKAVIDTIQELREEHAGNYKLNSFCVLAELRGSQIRTQTLDGPPIVLKKGANVNICVQNGHDSEQFDEEDKNNVLIRVNLPSFEDLASRVDLEQFDQIFIDYGRLVLRVDKISEDGHYIRARLTNSGKLGSNKFVTFYHQPDRFSITEKDRNDLEFCVKSGVDVIAFPCVQSKDDVVAAQNAIKEAASTCGVEVSHLPTVFSKIADQEGLFCLDEIINESAGIIVSRGTLGVNLPLHSVAIVQKMIIDHCNAAHKPVIVSSQVLRSMYKNPRPTRAEISDVINSALDGCDCVMVAITAHGKYPEDAVRSLAAGLKEADRSDHALITRPIRPSPLERPVLQSSPSFTDVLGELEEEVNRLLHVSPEQAMAASLPSSASSREPLNTALQISNNAANMANRLDSNIMVVVSERGQTARFISKSRPKAIIMCATPRAFVARRLGLIRGVVPVVVDSIRSDTKSSAIDEKKISAAIGSALRSALELKMVQPQELVMVTSGVKTTATGSQTHVLEVVSVPQ